MWQEWCHDEVVIETDTTSATEAAMNDTIRTYETYEIVWTGDDGSKATWTNYDLEHAEATVRWANEHGSRHGEIVRRTFEVRIPADRAGAYRPGIAERPADCEHPVGYTNLLTGDCTLC